MQLLRSYIVLLKNSCFFGVSLRTLTLFQLSVVCVGIVLQVLRSYPSFLCIILCFSVEQGGDTRCAVRPTDLTIKPDEVKQISFKFFPIHTDVSRKLEISSVRMQLGQC